ncbi:MAG: hypothetical protein R3E79_32150 [Caldilineaceae bacterium]
MRLPLPAGCRRRQSCFGRRPNLRRGYANDRRSHPVGCATGARIAVAPPWNGLRALRHPALANAVNGNTFMALLGRRDGPGIYLLEKSGTVQPLWADENRAAWLSEDVKAGILLLAPDTTAGLNSFSWVRTDGSALRVFAQPFIDLRGDRRHLWRPLVD